MSADIEALKAALPQGAWTQDPDLIDPHLREWRDKYFGQTPILLTPRTTEEVAEAVKICAAHKLPIMPQGGNTGLVGGNTPQGEVLISLKKMTAVRDTNPTANAMTVEAAWLPHARTTMRMKSERWVGGRGRTNLLVALVI